MASEEAQAMKTAIHRHALVLFSGGQDSTTCLAHALAQYERVETLAFDYRQRHLVELTARVEVLAQIRATFPQWADKLGEDHLLDLGVLGQVSETSLTRDMAFQMEQSGLPNTFVPGRNLLFFDAGSITCVSPQFGCDRHGRVRNRFLRLPGLPRRYDESDANCAVIRNG